MVKRINVEGFDACMKAIEDNSGSDMFILFSGSKNESGESWCPDCVVAEPVVSECVQAAGDDAVFIYCGVGGRDFWKDQSNAFRKHEKLLLKGVPTLMKWGSPMKLVEADCAKKDMVSMMFED